MKNITQKEKKKTKEIFEIERKCDQETNLKTKKIK